MAKFIPYASLAAAPWKNGGGSTTEIAVFPAGAGFDDFDWRISLATIARSGAFSVFPGIDRSLTLVEGDGVTLTLDGQPFALCAAAPLIVFAGEAAVHATVASPTTDFNVMTRRSCCRHRLTRVAAPAGMARAGGLTLLFLAQGERAVIVCGARRHTLGRFDALLLDAGDGPAWQVEAAPGATVFAADLITD